MTSRPEIGATPKEVNPQVIPAAGRGDQATPSQLFQAVHALQGEASTLQKDKINPAFKSKYLSLDTLMEQVLPLLHKHGLAWITGPGGTADAPTLRYMLAHAETAETFTGEMPLLLDKHTPQGQGSAITYARRYTLMAVLGLVADEDDDGAAASRPKAHPKAAPISGPMSEAELAKLSAHVLERKGNWDLLLSAVGAESTDHLTAAQGRQIWRMVES